MQIRDNVCLLPNEASYRNANAKFSFNLVDECVHHWIGICFIKPGVEPIPVIFNFTVFVTALTLMAVVFTITDIRFRFRIEVAPIALLRISYWTVAAVGLLTLFSDVAFSMRWPIPVFLSDDMLWQASAAVVFLGLVLVWMYWGFVRPPVFGHINSQYYAGALYRIIVRGNPAEMATVASELGRSAKNIIAMARPNRPGRTKLSVPFRKWIRVDAKYPHSALKHAHAVLLLMGAKRFCKELVANSPGTAIAFFQQMAEQAAYDIPVRQFSTNLVGAAIENKQSLLYHEDSGFMSGALGYWKPFSSAIFGKWELVEALGSDNGAPLDVDYDYRRGWDAEQLEAYTRVVLITFNNYLETGAWRYHSYSLERAFGTIKDALSNTYKLDGQSTDAWASEAYGKLNVAVEFVREAIRLVEKVDPFPRPKRLRSGKVHPFNAHDMYDQLANLSYEIIEKASYVRRPEDLSWSVQHNAVWSRLFGITSDGKAWRVLQFKVRRLLYEEIVTGHRLNYRSSRILGMCLNVMGINSIAPKDQRNPDEYALHKALLLWCRRELMSQWKLSPEVVDSGLPENLKLDPKLRRLVRTYAKLLDPKPKVAYFQLD